MAELIVNILLGYAGIGVLFAVAFVTIGAGRLDPNAVGGPIGFRLLILPGAAALWPYLAIRWLTAGRPGDAA